MLYPDSVKTLRFSHYLLVKGDIFVLDDDKYPRDPRFEDPYNHVYAVEDSHEQLYAVVDVQRYELRPLREIDPPIRKLRNRRCFVSSGAAEKPDAFGLFDDPVATGQRATTHEQQCLQDYAKTTYLGEGQYVDALDRNMPKLKKHLRNLYCSIS